ncbi:hypothetical protein BKA62DRAFT_668044 [Auriculariales sp. MPI-PUGE-AT-0066]|nr:hypothetical protein BKA62DRAFT_668044 [Auriculariales sp. MPI-PUGE-AT-0066]
MPARKYFLLLFLSLLVAFRSNVTAAGVNTGFISGHAHRRSTQVVSLAVRRHEADVRRSSVAGTTAISQLSGSGGGFRSGACSKTAQVRFPAFLGHFAATRHLLALVSGAKKPLSCAKISAPIQLRETDQRQHTMHIVKRKD